MSKLVLLIEDVQTHRAAFTNAVRPLKWRVEFATNLEEAHEKVEKKPFGPWDLIVMDVQVPTKSGGIAEVRNGPKMFDFIWPLVAEGKLLIWSVHLGDKDVMKFLTGKKLLQFTVSKGLPPARLRTILLEAMTT